ncbi:hypothetical protein PS467_09155 [Streptomyces luomodiensis]|uniref:Dephospho-CoA kinase n=1 Tax=Streptomyces luomodiensis TaxID=3026192 RepID=A0ABY9V082_9ACTN|nr:hypothetical protein [Streptomyces sp. SCA4-21]WNE95499.1 hypothetical protein PS467_09155 [Streptomyces sp. SCA4-21]
MYKIAFTGPTGSGKTTARAALLHECEQHQVRAASLRLAEPLYQLQNIVYTYAGRPLAVPGMQDGALLASLAGHLRRIAPDAITDNFAARLANLEASGAVDLVICEDLRRPDLPAMRRLGFVVAEIATPQEQRHERLAHRGDITPVDEAHEYERPLGDRADYHIDNTGSQDALRRKIAQLLIDLSSLSRR